jgi:SET domain-containing protein
MPTLKTARCPGTYVDTSTIHGRGLFAARHFHAGQTIGRLVGPRTRRDGPYVLWLDEAVGIRVTNDLRFINHSSDPNAVYYDDLTVAAICDIYPGDEITHNYHGDDDAPGEIDFGA